MGFVLEQDAVRRRAVAPREVPENSMWTYSVEDNTWHLAYKTNPELVKTNEWGTSVSEPRPRYAHQLAFDPNAKVHYLFGGNPNTIKGDQHEDRLADFWALKLVRPSIPDLLQKSVFSLRRQHFLELCRAEGTAALRFLQGTLRDAVDHTDTEQVAEFQRLSALLFTEKATEDVAYSERNHLYESIIANFPSCLTQPTGDIARLVDPFRAFHDNT